MGQGRGYFLEILGYFFWGECGGVGSASAWLLVSGRGVEVARAVRRGYVLARGRYKLHGGVRCGSGSGSFWGARGGGVYGTQYERGCAGAG